MALRNAKRGEYHELLVVSSVATVVTVRIALHVSGYPQIGGGSLHIAHLLWGGLLMLAAALVLLTYLSRSMMRLGAVLAGVGFGLFVDEVGKFVTADNDYFFRPALTLIYICFAVLFLLTRRAGTIRKASDAEVTLNATLDESDSATGRYVRARARVAAALDRRWLTTGVTVIFVLQAVIYLVTVVLVILLQLNGVERQTSPIPQGQLPFAVAALVCRIGYSALVLVGVIRFVGNRIAGLTWLGRATLFNLLLVQPFQIYQLQISALVGLGFNLVAYAVLRLAVQRLDEPRPTARTASEG